MGTYQRGFLKFLFSPFLWAVMGGLFVLFVLSFGRQWYDSIVNQLDFDKKVHPDQSSISTNIQSQVDGDVTLISQNKDGKVVKVIANTEDFSEFVKRHAENLERARQALTEQTDQQLEREMSLVFSRLRERVPRYADWYFAYTTTYKILWEATTSASRHVVSAGNMPLNEAVAYDVEKYLQQHYETIVLRPEITDVQLKQLYENVLYNAHQGYINMLSMMQADFQVLVAKYTTHLHAPENAQLVLDWESQFNKISMADYEKGVTSAAVGGGLAAGGAIAGKAIGGVVGKGISAKVVASSAGKGLFAKLGAPFVTKAVAVGAGGAAGALGGPIGVAIGAGIGLGVDYLISEGVELVQRDKFLSDVKEALDTTQHAWQKDIQKSLHHAIDVWFEDTIQLLAKYEE